jgi:AraC family transcriptional regulator
MIFHIHTERKLVFKISVIGRTCSFILGKLYKIIVFYDYCRTFRQMIVLKKTIILENKVFQLLGCVYYGDPFHEATEWSYENEIGKLWNRFGKLAYKYSNLLRKIALKNEVAYELHLEPEEFMETKNYYVMVGMEIRNFDEIPLEMYVKVLPKTSYLVFSTTMDDKFKIGGYVYRKWIPENNYEQSYPYIIQLYDRKRYKGLDDPKSEIDWYIPVKKLRE